MPIIPGFSRRRGAASDVDIRRHSFYSAESASHPTVIDGRASEQIPRRLSAAEFLSPLPAGVADQHPLTTRTSAERETEQGERSQSPPVQEQTPKHHRFSMLRFRHASDSQLSTRARLQAQAAPPVPHRECSVYPLGANPC